MPISTKEIPLVYNAPAETKNFVPMLKRLIRFVQAERIQTIVVAGSSAQNAAFALKEAWKAFCPASQKMPAFVAVGTIKADAETQYKVPGRTNELSKEEIAKKIKARLTRKQTDRVMILDEYYESGSTLSKFALALKSIGIRNAKKAVFAVAVAQQRFVEEELDFVGSFSGIVPEYYRQRRNLIANILSYNRVKMLPKELREAKTRMAKFALSELRKERAQTRQQIRKLAV
jgi:hypoxanthine phosphoribosyltransferase